MDFRDFVPEAVRACITTLIEGDAREPQGLAASLRNADKALVSIDQEIESCRRQNKGVCPKGLRKQKADARVHRDKLQDEVDCLLQLARDERMRDAFALLADEFTDDKQWQNFISAAWAARQDFARHRDQLRQADELSGSIARASQKLAALIRKFEDTGINGPAEFHSIPELLRKTDSHDPNMWRTMRRHILGDMLRRGAKESEPAEEGGETWITIAPLSKAGIDPEAAQNALRYAWESAPDFPALLETVAIAARDFRPGKSGVVGAAIHSRQQNTKIEYVRAFGKLLIDVHAIVPTEAIMHAMAVTATVVTNRDVTHKDVQRALA